MSDSATAAAQTAAAALVEALVAAAHADSRVADEEDLNRYREELDAWAREALETGRWYLPPRSEPGIGKTEFVKQLHAELIDAQLSDEQIAEQARVAAAALLGSDQAREGGQVSSTRSVKLKMPAPAPQRTDLSFEHTRRKFDF